MIESTRYANKMCQNRRFKQFQIRKPLIFDVPFSQFLYGMRSTKQDFHEYVYIYIRSRNHPARKFMNLLVFPRGIPRYPHLLHPRNQEPVGCVILDGQPKITYSIKVRLPQESSSHFVIQGTYLPPANRHCTLVI